MFCCVDFVEVFNQRPDSTYVVPPEPVTKADSDDAEEDEETDELRHSSDDTDDHN